jgi:hypothetical protein
VTLEPEYYPQANLAFQGLTAAEDAAAKTEAPLAVVADGAVTGGTLMYYVTTDKNFDQDDAIALAETEWSAAIPTAETVEAAGTCYVWYYIKGDAEHSDTDPKPLQVTVLPEPTYTVEFAEGTPETDKWTAEPNTDVTKGQTVTVTYTGSKKVLGVKAEKKAKAPAPTLAATLTTAGMTVSVSFLLHDKAETVNFTSNGDGTYTKTGGTGTTATAPDWTIQLVENNGLIVFKAHESDTGENSDEAFKFNFFPSDNTYYMWRGLQAQYDFEVTFTSISVNGTAIAVTEAQDN